jgi:hypothetical protein
VFNMVVCLFAGYLCDALLLSLDVSVWPVTQVASTPQVMYCLHCYDVQKKCVSALHCHSAAC